MQENYSVAGLWRTFREKAPHVCEIQAATMRTILVPVYMRQSRPQEHLNKVLLAQMPRANTLSSLREVH